VTRGPVEQDHATSAGRLRLLSRILLALSLGGAGGVIFSWLGLPLPWLLGPMLVNLVGAMLQLPIAAPNRLRPYVIVVIGVLLGSGFTPDVLGQVSGWAISLLFLAFYLIVSGVLVVPYYRFVGRFDPVSAYFAGMPGGLSEMMIIGKDMGGDDKAIILAHASRILIVVCVVAVWFRLVLGVDMGNQAAGGVRLADIPGWELGVLALCGGFGLILGRVLRLPAPTLLGPMILSSLAHGTGLVFSAPPRELVVIAQIFLGTIMGCRFIGTRPAQIGGALVLGLGATVLMLSVTAAFAVLLHRYFGQSLEQVILAYAPGGLTEMSLVALAMQADVTYVAAHHLLRITLVILVAPFIFSTLRLNFGKKSDTDMTDREKDD
jgi:hypothetical protein